MIDKLNSMETGNSWAKLKSSPYLSPKRLSEHEQGQLRVKFLKLLCLSFESPLGNCMSGVQQQAEETMVLWLLFHETCGWYLHRLWRAHTETTG